MGQASTIGLDVAKRAVQAHGADASGRMAFRARDLLVHQRTWCVNALRGHLSEYGYVFSQGVSHAGMPIAFVEDPAFSHRRVRGQSWRCWPARMLTREPKMLVTVALANKTARTVWVLLVKCRVCKAPVATA